MKTIGDVLAKFFGVIVRPQTYLNALYLLLAFPLGLFYFIFLVVGLALGIPLIIIWVGVLILLAVFAMWYALIVFERQMAIWLLQEDIPPISRQPASAAPGIWQTFTATLTNPVTWKGLVFLFAKFPLGIISFVMLVTLGALSGALLTAPLYYWWANPVIEWGWRGTWFNPVWVINSLPEALLASLIGVFVLLISLHIWNLLAWLSGKFAWLMLGNFSAAPAAASTAVTPLVEPVQPSAAPTQPLSEPMSSEPAGLEAAVPASLEPSSEGQPEGEAPQESEVVQSSPEGAAPQESEVVQSSSEGAAPQESEEGPTSPEEPSTSNDA